MPRPLILVSALAVAACSLLAAGCGGAGSGSGSPGVANVGSTTTPAAASGQASLAAYSQCMRTHGVPTFPGPDATGGIAKPAVIAASQANPSKFDSAQSACQHLQPTNGLGPPETPQQQATQRLDALSFAKCMRSHGVSRFPDPNSQGQLSVAMVEAQGIDVHSPAVLHIVQTCLPASHGALTPAKVAEALHNASG